MYKPNIPDSISLIRLFLALPCAGLIVTEDWTLAALLFSLAVGSDLLDGYLARRWHISTRLGAVLDHGSDAIFVSASLAGLAYLNMVSWFLPPMVFLAFVQYSLDSRVLRGGSLIASQLGRYNGILYFLLAGCPIYQHSFKFYPFDDRWILLASWVLLLSTLISMFNRWRMTRTNQEEHTSTD